jgi:hypothetical protein
MAYRSLDVLTFAALTMDGRISLLQARFAAT